MAGTDTNMLQADDNNTTQYHAITTSSKPGHVLVSCRRPRSAVVDAGVAGVDVRQPIDGAVVVDEGVLLHVMLRGYVVQGQVGHGIHDPRRTAGHVMGSHVLAAVGNWKSDGVFTKMFTKNCKVIFKVFKAINNYSHFLKSCFIELRNKNY